MYVYRIASRNVHFYCWRHGNCSQYESAGLSKELRGHYKRVMIFLVDVLDLRSPVAAVRLAFVRYAR
jgi:hypothetical protein